MARALADRGLRLGGEVTQGLSQADLFDVAPPPGGGGAGGARAGAAVAARLRQLDVPVRATVLPLLQTAPALVMHDAAAAALAPLIDSAGIWWQDPGLFHATLWHASTHGVRRRAR